MEPDPHHLLGFDELARRILARPCRHLARVVAVDGGAGAGKTTFAALLARYLEDAPVIPMDDFNAFDDLTEYFPRFEEQVLAPLFTGRDLRYQKRDWVNDMTGSGLGEFRDVPFRDVMIFEGIGSARRALQGHLTCSVWIAAPAELRLARGLERDGHVEGLREIWERFMPSERQFFELEGTAERADFVVDGTTPFSGDPPRFRVLADRTAPV